MKKVYCNNCGLGKKPYFKTDNGEYKPITFNLPKPAAYTEKRKKCLHCGHKLKEYPNSPMAE